MTTPTIFDTCEPRDDVLSGAIADADFAADLASVIAGTATPEYRDPARFFADTYPTRGLKNLLANVSGRLSGAGDEVEAIFRLDTAYGGGKTHGLIALAHLATGLANVANIAEFVNEDRLPERRVRIAAFDGENADPANGRAMGDGVLAHTPWGRSRTPSPTRMATRLILPCNANTNGATGWRLDVHDIAVAKYTVARTLAGTIVHLQGTRAQNRTGLNLPRPP